MLEPGQIIGNRYEIIELIGTGGMADVYKAKCHKLNRYVAIKVLKREYQNDSVFLQKFQAEAQVAATLTHQNIVSIYDVGEEQGSFYIVMEYVDGITLKQYIRERGRLLPQEVVDISMQIALGIQVAHSRHTIHRDIKPQNILVTRNGIVKITDFGIARAASANTVTSMEVAGSVHYISPEQARGAYSDERSDLYSFGVTMYEMATGIVPFDGDNNVTIALAHIQKEPIQPTAYYNDIPESLNRIILKMMQKKQERRYQTVQELLLDLKRVWEDPSGEYVRIVPMFTDSPTIMMSETERNKIKSGIKNKEQVEVFPTKEEPIEQEQKQEKIKKENEQPRERQAKEEQVEEEQPKKRSFFKKRETTDVEDDEDDKTDPMDERNSEGMDPKLEKLVFVLGIVAAVLVAMFVIFTVSKSLKLFSPKNKPNTDITTEWTAESSTTAMSTTSSKQVAMIQIVGKKYDEAQTMVEQIGLSLDPEFVKSDSVEKDYIISQNVREGEMVAEGTQIKVEISLGSESVTVPDFIGDTKEEAQRKAESAKVRVQFRTDYDKDAEKDTVCKQSITSGNKVEPDTTVTLTISLGAKEEKPKVPNFSGMSKADAQDLAKELGLILKPIETYNESAQGLIFDQDTAANKKVEKGTIVTVYISKGVEPAKTYTGTFTVGNGANPFTEGEYEEGYVKIIADQDGDEKVVFEGTLTYEDFPKTITFTSKSSETAHVYMTVDGEQTNFVTVVAMNE